MRATLPIACLLFLSAAPLAAQDRIGHTRHEHPHNPKHPVAGVTTERFHTSREGTTLPALTGEEPMFSFAIFGDRTGGPATGVSILADAVRDVNLLEPDLVMTVGDLIQGYNQTDDWMRDMTEYKGIMDNLICPWFPVAGNHDIYWRGPNAPEYEHEASYETHFGPLWYAFEHKNCWFVVLYSDEGDPATGEKTFNKPESQRMSDEQLDWLKQTLDRGKDADHIFVFIHHPRWIGRNYGDDWRKVHAALVDAGNVSAVFGGHIHHMRYDPKDGIHYVTLATTGGHQPGIVPAAGYLHHYNLVTVRKQQLGITAYPIGAALDVRDLTPELLADLQSLASIQPAVGPVPRLADDGSVSQRITLTMENPAKRPIELTLTNASDQGGWTILPDHRHLSIQPGESASVEFDISRAASPIGDDFAAPQLAATVEYLSESSRYPLPETELPLPFTLETPPAAPDATDHALSFDGKDDFLTIPSGGLPIDRAFTLECWFNARSYGSRTGLITKTENSDYGFFVNDGRPEFIVLIGDSYLKATAGSPLLKTRTWHHLAGIYDGSEVRLYLDGELIDSARGEGERRTNDLPLVIGADVSRREEIATSHFNGFIDAVRLSSTARYEGDSFEPSRRLTADDETLLLLNMDRPLGGRLMFDESPRNNHPVIHGEPRHLLAP